MGNWAEKKRAVKAAFPFTIPVLVGYLFIGTAFGILAQSQGYGLLWGVFMSLIIYSGSMQFVAVSLLAAGTDIFSAAIMTFMVNIRYMFYGIPLLERYKNMGRRKLYSIFSLTDETFSLACSTNPPKEVPLESFLFSITTLNQLYWVVGTIIGELLGAAITCSTQGVDFAMTALFVVIFVEQWQARSNRIPALVGLAASLLCLVLFGAQQFLLPAMLCITGGLLLLRKKLEPQGEASK